MDAQPLSQAVRATYSPLILESLQTVFQDLLLPLYVLWGIFDPQKVHGRPSNVWSPELPSWTLPAAVPVPPTLRWRQSWPHCSRRQRPPRELFPPERTCSVAYVSKHDVFLVGTCEENKFLKSFRNEVFVKMSCWPWAPVRLHGPFKRCKCLPDPWHVLLPLHAMSEHLLLVFISRFFNEGEESWSPGRTPDGDFLNGKYFKIASICSRQNL